jgi:glycosyltransferase involved in cell wall biosynthesis
LHQERSAQRYTQDIELLLLDQKEEPDNPRHTYYLARTHYSLKNPIKSSEYFRKRISMVEGKENMGSIYEIYNSMFYLSVIAYELFLADKKKETFEIAISSFTKCHETFPHRAEPLYFLVIIMNHFEYEKRKELIISTLEKAIQIPISSDNDIYYEIYQFKIPYMLAFHYYKNKEFEKSLKIIEQHYHPEIKLNMKYDNLLIGMKAFKPYTVDHYSDPVIVIYVGNTVPFPWNGLNFNSLCSGSERMAVLLAEYFSTSGKQAHIFCECTGMSGLVNGVEYHPYQEYYEFIRTHYIDALIISREAEQLSYLKHIRNVLLWIHDVEPFGNEFQTGPAFRGLVALSNCHKLAILKSFPMPEQYIKVIGNALTPHPELLVYPKKPLQCIYTSSPDRGLDIMIKIILKAVKTLPTITLTIYANEELIHPESMQRIRAHPERFTLLPRTTSKELHRSFSESDYWIYPTSFIETYCITALEAQYYQCVCITTGVGSLSEIVGQRGILLTEKPDSDDIIGETVKKIEFMERNPTLKDMYRSKGHEWAEKQVMKEVGKKWEQLIQY